MHISYFITAPPRSEKSSKALRQLTQDLIKEFVIKQLFFYSDAVEIAALEDYPLLVETFLEMAEDNNIALYVCRAGFQQRQLKLSILGQQDFSFKGLGQFIVESQDAQFIRHC